MVMEITAVDEDQIGSIIPVEIDDRDSSTERFGKKLAAAGTVVPLEVDSPLGGGVGERHGQVDDLGSRRAIDLGSLDARLVDYPCLTTIVEKRPSEQDSTDDDSDAARHEQAASEGDADDRIAIPGAAAARVVHRGVSKRFRSIMAEGAASPSALGARASERS